MTLCYVVHQLRDEPTVCAEGAQGIGDVHQSEEEQSGVCQLQRRWLLHHLGSYVSALTAACSGSVRTQ